MTLGTGVAQSAFPLCLQPFCPSAEVTRLHQRSWLRPTSLLQISAVLVAMLLLLLLAAVVVAAAVVAAAVVAAAVAPPCPGVAKAMRAPQLSNNAGRYAQ